MADGAGARNDDVSLVAIPRLEDNPYIDNFRHENEPFKVESIHLMTYEHIRREHLLSQHAKIKLV